MNRDHYLFKRLHHQDRAQVDQQGKQEKQTGVDEWLWLRAEPGEKATTAGDVSESEGAGRK